MHAAIYIIIYTHIHKDMAMSILGIKGFKDAVQSILTISEIFPLLVNLVNIMNTWLIYLYMYITGIPLCHLEECVWGTPCDKVPI